MQKGAVSAAQGEAEMLAIQALSFIAGEPDRFGAFLAETGIGPDEIRAAARQTHFLAGVLDYVTADEKLLIDFVKDAGVQPAAVMRARTTLGGPAWERDIP